MVDAVVVQEKKVAVRRQVEGAEEIDGGVELLRREAPYLVQFRAEVLFIPVSKTGRVLGQRGGGAFRCLGVTENLIEAKVIDALQELHVGQRDVLGEFCGGATMRIG